MPADTWQTVFRKRENIEVEKVEEEDEEMKVKRRINTPT